MSRECKEACYFPWRKWPPETPQCSCLRYTHFKEHFRRDRITLNVFVTWPKLANFRKLLVYQNVSRLIVLRGVAIILLFCVIVEEEKKSAGKSPFPCPPYLCWSITIVMWLLRMGTSPRQKSFVSFDRYGKSRRNEIFGRTKVDSFHSSCGENRKWDVVARFFLNRAAPGTVVYSEKSGGKVQGERRSGSRTIPGSNLHRTEPVLPSVLQICVQ